MAGGPYNYNYIFKYIIIGDMGVGKSCLLHQFTEKKCKYMMHFRVTRTPSLHRQKNVAPQYFGCNLIKNEKYTKGRIPST